MVIKMKKATRPILVFFILFTLAMSSNTYGDVYVVVKNDSNSRIYTVWGSGSVACLESASVGGVTFIANVCEKHTISAKSSTGYHFSPLAWHESFIAFAYQSQCYNIWADEMGCTNPKWCVVNLKKYINPAYYCS